MVIKIISRCTFKGPTIHVNYVYIKCKETVAKGTSFYAVAVRLSIKIKHLRLLSADGGCIVGNKRL